jgi:hypothetical protein
MRHSRFSEPLAACVIAAGAVVLVMAATRPGRTAPLARQGPAPPAPVLSGQLPHQVPLPPPGLSPLQSRPWFDTFSWQEFIALNWPAVANQRGVPNQPNNPATFKAAFAPNAQGNYPTVVWGTWKQAYELFEQGSQRPTQWSSFTAVLPCQNPNSTPPPTFLDDTPNDINESFSNPLIDQALQYTRYEIRFNETEYNFIRGQDAQPSSWLYLTPNLNAALPLTFPQSTATTYGAIELKAAWKPITASDDKGRYYIVNALVFDPIANACSYQQMGLVGFHIAHKTSPFSEWVWSTFEHVDNVVVGPNAPAGTKPSYNNGTPNPPTPNGYDIATPNYPPMLAPAGRQPVQVTRVNPIPTTPPNHSTVDLNAAFQALVAGTVWQNYELIATQWPTMPGSFVVGGAYPQDCGSPFPQSGVINTTAETYVQPQSAPLGNNCMQCHYLTAATDFSWVLPLRAHAPVSAQNHMAAIAKRVTAVRGIDNLPPVLTEATDKSAGLRANIEKLKAARAKIKTR